MPATVATLNPSGGRPSVEIIIGNAQRGTYEFSLFDSNGANRTVFATGRTDTIPDIFQIPGATVPAMANNTIMWRSCRPVLYYGEERRDGPLTSFPRKRDHRPL